MNLPQTHYTLKISFHLRDKNHQISCSKSHRIVQSKLEGTYHSVQFTLLQSVF